MEEECDYRVLSRTQLRAAIKHACSYEWCKKPIKKGERYIKYAVVDIDGKFFCTRIHTRHEYGYS